MRTRLLVVAFLLLAPLASFGQEVPVTPIEGITLRLEIPAVKEGEKQVLRGVLKNESKNAVEVPAAYDGHTMSLNASAEGLHWPMRLWRRERVKLAQVKVSPGEGRTLFELPLSLLVTGRMGVGGDQAYHWDWMARSFAPPSPFHTKNGEQKDEALFWLLVRFGDKSASSPRIRVKWEEMFRVVDGK